MPRIKRKEPRVRLNLELTENVVDRLERLRELSEADSRTEVIRRALSVYDLLLEQSNQGATLILRYEDQSEKEVLLI